jgi:hypothetical protein
MADTPNTAAKAAQAKPAAKRKPARRKPAPKRTPAARKSAARKPAARTPAAKRAAPKAGKRFATNAQETGREVFLAGLGFYGKAYDQAQERFEELQKELKARRKNADKVYKELVKRGKKVEKDAKGALDDIEIPGLDSLTDRKKLEERLKKARARFEEMRKSARTRSAA